MKYLQFCNEFAVPKDEQEHFKCITPGDIICSQVVKETQTRLRYKLAHRADFLYLKCYLNQTNGGLQLKEDDIAVRVTKIDLTRGRNNPLERYRMKSYLSTVLWIG